MATIVTRAGKGTALTWVEADANFTNLNSAKLENIVEDLTPQLGADLDVNGKNIVSVSNGNINITPNGTGVAIIDGIRVGQGANNVSTNSAVGTSALSGITSGGSNSGFGYNALRDTSNGIRNTAIGTSTIVRNNAGGNNTAVGYNALNYTVASNNTAVGSSAGSLIDGGATNTLLGYNSGSAITTGSNNVIIGSNTGSTIATSSNNIIISDGAGNIRLSFDSTGNGNINGILTVDKLQVDTSVITGSTSVGQLAWNDAEGTLEFLMKGGNVNLQLGQEQVLMVNNNTGSTLVDGQIVYITGSQGQRPTVSLANASTEATSSKTIGMVTETILNGADGFITTTGIVNGLNTIAYAAGTALWLSTSAGSYTDIKPSSPNNGVFIGWVVRSHAVAGSIYVHIQNGYELNELHDVLISSAQNNQILKYNGTSAVWENWTPNFLSSSDIGSTVQAYDNDLTAWAGISTSAKQDTLVDGLNIKTINGNNITGPGNLVISAGAGLGSITAYKADGSQDNIDVTANTTLTQIGITQELLADSDMVYAIESTGTYGWNDITSEITVKGSGANNPSWATVRNGLNAYIFSATVMQEAWVNFHIPHSYTPGTNIFLHTHWVNPGTNTGVVRWGFEYSFAKGFGQEIFPATTTVYVEQAPTGQYYHMVAEISAGILSTALEVDGILMVRVFRDAANAADTCTDAVALLTADVHHQTSRWATKNKAPNFYN